MQRRGSAELPVSPLAWPVPLAGAIAAAWAAAASLLAFAVIFSVLWVFTADPRASVGGAVRSAAALWLLAHSVPVTYAGVTVSIAPLLVTAPLVWLIAVATRWSVRNSIVLNLGGALGLLGSIAGFYALAGGLVSLWLAPVVRVNSSRALLGCFGWALFAAAVGLWRSRTETGPVERRAFSRVGERTVPRIRVQSPAVLLGRQWSALPVQLRVGIQAGLRSFGGWLLMSFGVGLLAAVLQFGDMLRLLTSLAPDLPQRIEFGLLTVAYLPTLVGWSLAVLLGPGLDLGGSSYWLLSQQLGALPAFPLFALLPVGFPSAVSVLALLPLVSATVTASRLRVQANLQTWLGYLGALAGCAGLCAALAAGAFGAGRFADIGPRPLAVAGAAAAFGLIGAVLAGLIARVRADGGAQPQG